MLQHLGERFIIGGDYNAKNMDWGSRLTTTKGQELKKAIKEVGCHIHSTGRPTYWPTDFNKIPDLLDFFITKKISPSFIEVSDILDLDSDHTAVLLTLSVKIVRKEANSTLVNKSTNWDCFKNYLQNNINLQISLKSIDQLETQAEKYMTIIQRAAYESTRQVKYTVKASSYPIEIRTLIANKRKARKVWQISRDPTKKTILNNISQRLKREIQKFKDDSINTYVRNLSATKDTDYSMWKATKKISKQITSIPPLRTENGSWAKSNKQKAELFADHLEDIFKPNAIAGENLSSNTENKETLEIRLTTPEEVTKEIQENLSTKKTPGFDLITAEILKQLPRKAIVLLTFLFNAAFRLKYIPTIWKVAEVIMILKPGKPPNDVKSYRPISLLPIISKLFEKILLKRLNPVIEQKKLIPNHQFGFRQKHSTCDQVHRITNVIEKALEEKMICSAVFLDVSQAFDKVWHEGLLHKLRSILPKQFVALLTSYVSDRTFRVKHDQEYSQLRDIKAGVPQGSVLAPLLYLLYTSDVPVTDGTLTATFADDTALLAVDKTPEAVVEKLQNSCEKLVDWTKKWKIKLNETKSNHVNFTNKRIVNPPILYINGAAIPHVNEAKYLGLTLDAKLRWKCHVKKKKAELGFKYSKYYWLLGRNSQLSLENKLLIYNQVFKPVWLYGIQLWGCAKDSSIKVIQTFQNKVLRNVVNAPWYVRNNDIHRDLGIPMVKDEVKRLATKHQARLQEHVNAEIPQLLDNLHLVRRLKRKKPFELIQ